MTMHYVPVLFFMVPWFYTRFWAHYGLGFASMLIGLVSLVSRTDASDKRSLKARRYIASYTCCLSNDSNCRRHNLLTKALAKGCFFPFSYTCVQSSFHSAVSLLIPPGRTWPTRIETADPPRANRSQMAL